MGKHYARAEAADIKLLSQAASKWHRELVDHNIEMTLIIVSPELDQEGLPKQPAITKSGTPVVACVRLVPEHYRLLCGIAVVIEVDGYQWKGFESSQKLAVLDHELEHVQIHENPKTQSPVERYDGSPKLYLKPDDWHLSGFLSVAQRHGEAAVEVQTLQRLRKHVQGLFDFASEEEKATPATRKAG